MLIFGASFVGMCSQKVFNDFEVIVGAIIFTALYTNTVATSFEIGGALGFKAFISIVAVWILSRGYKKILNL